MEVELKYAIADEATADRIWEDEWLAGMAEPQTRSCERFHGAYYDTADRLLLQNKIAFRVRQEGHFIVAALKWDGDSEGALHKREELNVTIGSVPEDPEGGEAGFGPEGLPEDVDLKCFEESDIGARVIALTEGKKLQKLMETDVSRRHMRVDTGSGIHEVSIDTGLLKAGGRSSPILEIEIEQFQGEEEDLLKTGKVLEEKYDLTPEHRSKFARGLTLLGIEK